VLTPVESLDAGLDEPLGPGRGAPQAGAAAMAAPNTKARSGRGGSYPIHSAPFEKPVGRRTAFDHVSDVSHVDRTHSTE